MSEISDMIQRLCPDGVEYRKLGEVCNIKRGERVTKAQVQKEGTFPVVSGGVTPMGYLEKYNRRKNTITVAQYGSAGHVAMQKTDFWANDVCYSVFPTEEVDNKFLYYAMLNSGKKIDSMVNRDAVPYHLPQDRLLTLLIPVPPLEVQRKIGEVLDNFSELTAELEARRKQYEYYRDNLLNFNRGGQNVSDVKWMKLGEVGVFIRGAGIQKRIFVILELVVFTMGKYIRIIIHLQIRQFLSLAKIWQKSQKWPVMEI